MCTHCDGNTNDYYITIMETYIKLNKKIDLFRIYVNCVENGEMVVRAETIDEKTVARSHKKINYCPFCGRKL